MIITRLNLTDFRNIRSGEVLPHPHFNILSGHNGAGKSNVLEAIFIMSNVKSFRSGKNADLVNLNSKQAEIRLKVDRSGVGKDLRVEIGERRKRFWINENAIKSFSDYAGALRTVIFSPADLRLLHGSSKERRAFIDRIVCNTQPVHLVDLQNFETALKSRNQLLKDPQPDRILLDAYTDQFCPLAARIIARRNQVLSAIEPTIRAVFHSIFAPGFDVRCLYFSKWRTDQPNEANSDLPTVERTEEILREHLVSTRHAERRAGFTLVGPHRDDIKVFLNDLPTREYASQGQARAIVLAMKITEIRYIEEVNRECPVLLLDDVSSELDRTRNEQLFSFIRELSAQTFITTTDRRFIGIEEDVAEWVLRDGELSVVD